VPTFDLDACLSHRRSHGPGGGTPEPGEDDDGEAEKTATQDETEDGDEESEKIEFEGVVQSIAGSQWVVDGQTIRVDGQTEVKDDPGVGDTVKVVAFLQPDGTWWAEKIELED
jgi:type VI secretion system secreted protein VgrG